MVCERVTHHEAGMSGCAAEVYEPSVGKERYPVPVGEDVAVHLRFYVLAFNAGKFL